jgi:hypothetical protein
MAFLLWRNGLETLPTRNILIFRRILWVRLLVFFIFTTAFLVFRLFRSFVFAWSRWFRCFLRRINFNFCTNSWRFWITTFPTIFNWTITVIFPSVELQSYSLFYFFNSLFFFFVFKKLINLTLLFMSYFYILLRNWF